MPHDVNGKLLRVGDRVTILAIVTSLSTAEDFCNVDLETVHGRRPDGLREHLSAINTGVLELVEAEADAKPRVPERNVRQRLDHLESAVFGGAAVDLFDHSTPRLASLPRDYTPVSGIDKNAASE